MHTESDKRILAALPKHWPWTVTSAKGGYRGIHRDGRAQTFDTLAEAQVFVGSRPYSKAAIAIAAKERPELAARWKALNNLHKELAA